MLLRRYSIEVQPLSPPWFKCISILDGKSLPFVCPNGFDSGYAAINLLIYPIDSGIEFCFLQRSMVKSQQDLSAKLTSYFAYTLFP